MAYTRLHWVESETPLSADNMNNIEDGIEELQSQKVDKVSGKALSDNNYTSEEKTKLAGIEEGAEVNVQPDWNQTNTSADDYIKNKPENATTSTAGFMSASDKSKLDGVQAGAQVNPGNATTSAAGLMSASDKSKLNGIETEATKTPAILMQILSGSSNTEKVTSDNLEIIFKTPITVQHDSYIDSGSGTKVKKQISLTDATTSARGLMTAADKTKLNGIATGATKNTDVATTSANGLMSASDKTKLDSIPQLSTTDALFAASQQIPSGSSIQITGTTSQIACDIAIPTKIPTIGVSNNKALSVGGYQPVITTENDTNYITGFKISLTNSTNVSISTPQNLKIPLLLITF